MAKTSVALLCALAALPAATAQYFRFPDCESGPLADTLVCDPSASGAERAAALVDAMTIDEKLANLVNESPGAPRLGLPPYEWWNEALHGVGYSPGVHFQDAGEPFAYATSFANPILLAAAFDDDLVREVADVISTEARAFSNAGHAGLDYWTPNINPYRDPRWGRGMETPGEDPLRIKRYVAALLSGLEGAEPAPSSSSSPEDEDGNEDTAAPTKAKRLIATCKHYAGNDLDRWEDVLRFNFDALITPQDLVEYHLPGFQQCARDSRVGSLMCAYNAVNGTPACANTYLMQTVLREHWGWDEGHMYVTSDCNAVANFHADHKWVETPIEAAAAAYKAGTDTVCEFGERTNVIGAWREGLLDEETVDRALRRLYHGLVTVGYFDPPEASPYRDLSWADVNTEKAQALALQSAVDGIVLLKNDGLLPLTYDPDTSVAVIGHWADAPLQLLGGYAGTAPYYLTPRYVASSIFNATHYATGPVAQNSSAEDNWTEDAMEAASQADVIFYFGGLDMTVEKEDRDRHSIAWPEAQLDLISALCSLGKPCVVAQLGNQVDDTPLLENANVSAVVWAGYPGQAGGTAVFDVIYGKSAPAGRLPVTQYPASYAEDVPMTDMGLRPAEGNPGRTYKWYDGAVLPFGYGLHYTTFDASFATGPEEEYDIAELIDDCDEAHLDLCPFGTVSVSVENTGDVESDFVSLVFVNGTYGPEPHPLKGLVGYSRLRGIPPGETKEADISLTLGDIARVDERGNTVLYPGRYTLQLDVPLRETIEFELSGTAAVLDQWPEVPDDLGAPIDEV